MSKHAPALEAKSDFEDVAGEPAQKQEAVPFCIRLTPDEKAYLKHKAGSRPLGRYIRGELLGKQAAPRRHLRQPKTDEKQVATLLAQLGASRIPNNLNQLAKHANMGTLDTSDDIEQQLQEACEAVVTMRDMLFVALGLRCGGDQ
ncbi:MAG: plasmid mobilization relaxosome protein MobC [Algicola sp.]|nr:plasmid mobilization relaxosome protein MobC [Algicola sp.]